MDNSRFDKEGYFNVLFLVYTLIENIYSRVPIVIQTVYPWKFSRTRISRSPKLPLVRVSITVWKHEKCFHFLK